MFNYITIGYDCSPAAALKNLHIRTFALPFDWVVSTISALDKCFRDNFRQYHRTLHYSHNKTRLIDAYGFEFPHDYPTNIQSMKGEDVHSLFHEEIEKESVITENEIVKNWADYHEIVLAKYNRRIQRFLNIMNDPAPIIVLCRYTTRDILQLQKLFLKYYHKENIYFINSSNEVYANDKIINIHTEKNGEWNDLTIWKSCIDKVIAKIDRV